MNEISGDAGGGREKKIPVNYPSNSKRGRPAEDVPPESRPRVEKVVEGEVTTRKRGVMGKFVHGFISEDAPGVLGWVTMEVLLPAAKSMFSDMVSQGVDRVLYGDSRPSRGLRQQNAYTNYTSRFGTGAPVRSAGADPRPSLSRQARATHEFDELVIPTRAEAEDILDKLRELISIYEVAKVSDYFDLAGVTGEFTDEKWGWDDLRSASIRSVRGGYIVMLPRTIPIT